MRIRPAPLAASAAPTWWLAKIQPNTMVPCAPNTAALLCDAGHQLSDLRSLRTHPRA